MKFKPETHETAGGYPWRPAGILGQEDTIAVKVNDELELLFVIDSEGKASVCMGNGIPSFMPNCSLIPIKREHNIPTSIDPKWKFAAKDKSGAIALNTEEPIKASDYWQCCEFGAVFYIDKIFPQAIADIPWDSGYFERVGDTDEWLFVEVDK